MSDTVVRSRSSGGALPAAPAMSGSTDFTCAGISRSGAISRWNAARSSSDGNRPSNMRCQTSSSVRFSASSTALYWR